MFPLGFLLAATAAYLVDCAIKNRPPMKTLEAIIRNPSHMREQLASKTGTGYVTPQTPGVSGSPALAGLLDPNGVLGATPAALEAVAWARTQIGKPYQYGATGPNAYDCSGLVQQAYKHAGVKLPRTSYQMIVVGKRVAQADLAIGDLVFPDPGHVQLYSGNGNVIEAPKTGLNVREVKMWGFLTARRVA